MGISVLDGRVGTIVWVQRKNGSWWPGRVVGFHELSPSQLFSVEKRTGTPIKLLGREHATVDWYNLEKSKRIKAFRCGEFDDCIERAGSSLASPSTKHSKYARREDAIVHALELEKQQLQKKHKRPGEKWAGTICRAKRSRCVFLPAESNNSLEHRVLHPQYLQVSSSPLGMDCYSNCSGSAEENTSLKSSKSDSSESYSRDPTRDERVTESSGIRDGQSGNMNCTEHVELNYLSDFPPENHTAADVWVHKWKVNIHNLTTRPGVVIDGKTHVRFKNETRDKGDPLTSNCAFRDHSRNGFFTKSRENLVWEANMSSPSALGGGYLEEPGSQCFGSQHTDHQNRMETMLIDVVLAVQPRYRAEHLPLVSLMSRLNGMAIIGHPIEIEASDNNYSEIPPLRKDDFGHKLIDGSITMLRPLWWRTCRRTPVCYAPIEIEASDNNYPEILPPRKDDIGHKLMDGSITMLQPLWWRTSRRTPVCYVPKPQPSSTLDETTQACQNSAHLILKARKNSCPITEEVPKKPLKRPSLSNRKRRKLSFATEQKHGSNGGDFQPTSQSHLSDALLKPEENLPTDITCVHVKHIFSKLLLAVGGSQS